MDRTLSLPIQEFIRACERIAGFASNHKGLPEADCEAVLFHALDLIRNLQTNCLERHGHNLIHKRAA